MCMQACSVMSKDYNLPGSSVHGIFQASILERVAISPSRGSSNLGIKPVCLLHWQVDSLPPAPHTKPNNGDDVNQMYFLLNTHNYLKY